MLIPIVRIVLIVTAVVLIGRALIFFFSKQEKNKKKAWIMIAVVMLEGVLGIFLQEGADIVTELVTEGKAYFSSDNKQGKSQGGEVEHIHTASTEKKENIIDETCTTAGSYDLVEYCECGKELSREHIAVEPLGHDYKETVVDPTCTEQGYTKYECSVYGDTYEENQTEALGHQFDEGICIRCGFEDPDYVKVFDGETIMEILSQSVASDSGTYANYLGSKSISVFAEEQHNCFSINTAVSYNMWGGNIQDVVFNISELNEIGTLNFKIGGETGSDGSMVVDIFVGQAIGDYPDYTYEIEASAEPIEVSIDITGANSLGIRVTNCSSNENRLVFFDFSAPNK
mgnify:FL=1